MISPEVIQVLHIAPHLGGGVGKALISLVDGSSNCAVIHSFLLLEKPEKTRVVDQLTSRGCKIKIRPDENEARNLILQADIVQLEWWNHPATFQFLCTQDLPPMRLLVWCHQSGLFPPLIPRNLITLADRFIFTSPCSFEASYISLLPDESKEKLGVISSGVGLQKPLPRNDVDTSSLRASYLGTLSFSKLHPEFVQFLAAVSRPGFTVIMIGDEVNRQELQQQCEHHGLPRLLDFTGFISDIYQALASADIFVYLLNPAHYGTAENALLEAMSAGVVPVVLNNPCEMAIVEDGKTGLVVDSPETFARAIDWLSDHPDEWRRLSRNASRFALDTFTPEKMAKAMTSCYRQVYVKGKRNIWFKENLGSRPSEWFLACQRFGSDPVSDIEKKYGQYNRFDKTKGSIQHFLKYFPDDEELKLIQHTVF
jgi:glycosyltransferase involved in cell wall biosynthesis